MKKSISDIRIGIKPLPHSTSRGREGKKGHLQSSSTTHKVKCSVEKPKVDPITGDTHFESSHTRHFLIETFCKLYERTKVKSKQSKL